MSLSDEVGAEEDLIARGRGTWECCNRRFGSATDTAGLLLFFILVELGTEAGSFGFSHCTGKTSLLA